MTHIILLLIGIVIVAGLLGFGIGVASVTGKREIVSSVLAFAIVICMFALVFG